MYVKVPNFSTIGVCKLPFVSTENALTSYKAQNTYDAVEFQFFWEKLWWQLFGLSKQMEPKNVWFHFSRSLNLYIYLLMFLYKPKIEAQL